MARQNVFRTVLIETPNASGLIVARGGDELAVRTNGYRRHIVVVALERLRDLAGFQIPNFGGAVGTSSDERFSIRKKRNTPYPARVPFESERFLGDSQRSPKESERGGDANHGWPI